jgi:BirA family transcriptional regulator, biotin operon repressor / biotin---[acetyl-CoA-carboxylase] ligase
VTALGHPRLHLRQTDSTNERARELAEAGAPHGSLVTADAQTAGRGRQGRRWEAPAGTALLCSLLVRRFDDLLSLRAGLAVADVAGGEALVKWPNDVLLDGRKVAGVLVEGRPQDGWAVVGIGINVAVDVAALGEHLSERAGTLGRPRSALAPALAELLGALERWLDAPADETLQALRARDALLGQAVSWGERSGVGAGIDATGALRVRLESGLEQRLSAGEVHLGAEPRPRRPQAG